MEPSLYSDLDGPDSAVKKLKRSMTLDFNSSSSTKQKKLATVLASPDLNMLKLASPELEKMIIQANGMVTTTPTPTQFIFPKYVTEEQEAYARGFVDALAELHSSGALNGVNGARPQDINRTFTTLTVPSALSQSAAIPSSAAVAVPTTANELSATTSVPGGLSRIPVTVRSVTPPPKSLTPTPVSRPNIPTTATSLDVKVPQIKEEPQTVPCMNSPPLSPINMESQEKIKLERKRARNRVAARKCRTRKLERISRLEDRVNELKGQNGNLVDTASNLRDQVMKLKNQIVDHVNSGCQIMMTQNIPF